MLSNLLSKLILKNVRTGQPSYTLTMVMIGTVVVNIKLLFSGIDMFGKFKMSDFSGTDYAAAIAALGAIHVGNKHFRSGDASSAENKDQDNA